MRAILVLLCAAAAGLGAVDAERDFSGKWFLDAGASDARALDVPVEQTLHVALAGTEFRVEATYADGKSAAWAFDLDGREVRSGLGAERRNTVVKWEGAALLVNTMVTGPADYTVMDRWRMARDGMTLTIVRQVVRASGEREGNLVYRREGSTNDPPPVMPPRQPSLTPRPAPVRPVAPTAPQQYIVPAGTRIPLTLRNPVDSKHSHSGDHVYLETAFPVAENGRIVIPRGSFVNGEVTDAKAAGVLKGKGELFIRFDVLMLPNGTSRDFRARPSSADKEGKITGSRDNSGDLQKATIGGGAGAGVGAAAGGIGGAGIGAAAGVAGGLLLGRITHRADAVLPQGTTVEMVLDRDLVFTPDELVGR